MPRAYLRLDPAFAERKSRYPDGAFRALVEVLCMAEFQPKRGRFRSQKVLKTLLEKRGRYLGFLLQNRDLALEKSGEVYVVGWDEWQEGDVTVTERQARIRNRRRNAASNGSDRDSAAIDRFSWSKESGSISGSVQPLRRPERPPLSDQEQREQLDRLAEAMSAEGIPMPKAVKSLPAVTDEELVERYRAIVDDPDEPEWRREAARVQLGLMGLP